MLTDKRADKIFRKKYYLKGNQVKHMQGTFNYQCLVLKLKTKDLLKIIKKGNK